MSLKDLFINLRTRRNLKRNAIEILVLMALLSLASFASSVQSQPRNDAALLAAYNAAIYDAAVYKSSNVRPLKPLKFDPVTKNTTVVTLTTFAYTPGTTTVPIYVWVTQVPEVQQICRTFTGDLQQSLVQLLGLIPNTKLGNFVIMNVAEGQIIRPATNPDPTTTLPCTAPAPPNCGQAFPQGVDAAYVDWFANKALSAWVVSEAGKPAVGYPWTRLGYTYNWKPGADKYGASEYVIKPGSTVTVREIVSVDKYCRSQK